MGADVAYNVAGQRISQTKDASLTGLAEITVEDGGGHGDVGGGGEGDPPTHTELQPRNYDGVRREEIAIAKMAS